jgi:N-acetyl-anhydromuramyl-L-alanine amidase AmpD
MNIRSVEFAASHYIDESVSKRQIYLHHTAGNDNAEGVFRYWASNKERVATFAVIDSAGTIWQGFPSHSWAYHLGVRQKTFSEFSLPYQNLDRQSIGIELCNWGYLAKASNGDYVTYLNKVVPESQVIELEAPFKGYKYWHNYTDEQIQAAKELIQMLCERYDIPMTYDEDIWSVTKRALSGASGIFTHNSVRKDKTDVYPHPKMIDMLKTLYENEITV